MRRRDFLITGSTSAVLSVAALSTATPARANAFGSEPQAVPSNVGVVLYEPRYVPSVAFARALERQGARAFSMQDDVVALWRGELGKCLDCAPWRVAGLTLHSDLEIFQMCAREQKLRVLHASLQRFDTSVDGKSGSIALSSWLIGR